MGDLVIFLRIFEGDLVIFLGEFLWSFYEFSVGLLGIYCFFLDFFRIGVPRITYIL